MVVWFLPHGFLYGVSHSNRQRSDGIAILQQATKNLRGSKQASRQASIRNMNLRINVFSYICACFAFGVAELSMRASKGADLYYTYTHVSIYIYTYMIYIHTHV